MVNPGDEGDMDDDLEGDDGDDEDGGDGDDTPTDYDGAPLDDEHDLSPTELDDAEARIREAEAPPPVAPPVRGALDIPPQATHYRLRRVLDETRDERIMWSSDPARLPKVSEFPVSEFSIPVLRARFGPGVYRGSWVRRSPGKPTRLCGQMLDFEIAHVAPSRRPTEKLALSNRPSPADAHISIANNRDYGAIDKALEIQERLELMLVSRSERAVQTERDASAREIARIEAHNLATLEMIRTIRTPPAVPSEITEQLNGLAEAMNAMQAHVMAQPEHVAVPVAPPPPQQTPQEIMAGMVAKFANDNGADALQFLYQLVRDKMRAQPVDASGPEHRAEPHG